MWKFKIRPTFLAMRVFVCASLQMLTVAIAAANQLQFEPYQLVTNAHGSQAAEIAWLDVPARHHNPTGPRFRLRVVRLAAPVAARGNAPTVYLAGGPGGSGVGTARGPRWPMFDRMRQHGDVLLFDQRGTGESSLPPGCPHQALPESNQAAWLANMRQTALRCVQFWRTQGVDLAAFSTVESADDVNALRMALGVSKLRLWGMSYGTHLGSSILRRHGAHIERAILMGYEGPGDTFKLPLSADQILQLIDARAMQDSQLAPDVRPLLNNIKKLLTQLERQPIKTKLLRSSEVVTIGKFEAQTAIAMMMIRQDFVRHLPLAIHLALKGEGGLLGEYVHGVQLGSTGFSAMNLAMDVASGVSATRLAQIQAQSQQSLLGGALNFPYPELGPGLNIPDLGDAYRAPLQTSVPTLFVSGTFDVRTPPANVVAALPGFSNASQLLIDGVGHDDDLWLSHPEIANTLEAFASGAWRGEKQLHVPSAFATSLLAELWFDLRKALGLPLIGLIVFGTLCLLATLVWWWRRRRARRALA